MTTGIWMYSEPFYHQGANGEEIAVLLVDTQGLFDNEVSQSVSQPVNESVSKSVSQSVSQ